MTLSSWTDPVVSPDLESRIRQVSENLWHHAVSRDLAGSAPHEEADLLKSADLTDLTLRPFAKGIADGAQSVVSSDRWLTALSAVRRLARADLSAAALLGYNYMTLWRIEASGNTDVFGNALETTLGSKAIWGGTNNPKGPTAKLVRSQGGYRITGRKTFATGSQSADFIVVGEQLEGETKRLNFYLPAAVEGLSHGDDWTAFGARRSASGSILFDDVFVPEESVFRSIDTISQKQEVARSSGSLSFQILFVNMLVGAAQGAVELALKYLSYRKATADESYISEIIGRAIADVNAAAALADRANDAFSQLTVDRYRQILDPVKKGVLGDCIIQAKIVADRVGLEAATRVLEATGARSANREEGFDRFWRDIRVYTLHDPVALRAREVGSFWFEASDPKGSDMGSFHTL